MRPHGYRWLQKEDVDPGSEWRLHRHWYGHSALQDLLDAPEALSDDVLNQCLDNLLAHRREFFASASTG